MNSEKYHKLLPILLILWGVAMSTPAVAATAQVSTTTSSAPVKNIKASAKREESPPQLSVSATNVMANDNLTAKLAKLNQDYEIAKAQQKIDELSGKSMVKEVPPHPVVIGVMINDSGNRLATIRFTSGYTLDVEIGSMVNGMLVRDITLDGVTLTGAARHCKKKKHCQPQVVFYKRVDDLSGSALATYSASSAAGGGSGASAGSGWSNRSNVIVPPIVGQ